MTARVFNFGSLNIDRIYRVPHIARPGETLASHAVQVLAGGKGANQSVALARAGARVAHCGKIGPDGDWLLEKLAAEGIDTLSTGRCEARTGEAIIQVGEDGENAIVLVAGANQALTRADIDHGLSRCEQGSLVLTQNETSEVGYIVERAASMGLAVVFNPAPFSENVLTFRLEEVTTLIVNEIEGEGLTGASEPELILKQLRSRVPRAELILTLGSRGAVYDGAEGRLWVPAVPVEVVDTTAAGDTFIGFYLAERMKGTHVLQSLQVAVRAAGVCVSRAGAMDAIPGRADLGNQV